MSARFVFGLVICFAMLSPQYSKPAIAQSPRPAEKGEASANETDETQRTDSKREQSQRRKRARRQEGANDDSEIGQLLSLIKELQAEVSDLRHAIKVLQRDRAQSEERDAVDSSQTNADKQRNSQCDVATSLPDGTPFRNIKSGIPASHRSWAEPGDEVVLRSPQTEEGELATMLPDRTPFWSTKSGIPQANRSWVEPGDKVVLRPPVPEAKQRQ